LFKYSNNVLLKIIAELLQLAMCLFRMTVKIYSEDISCTHKENEDHFN